ncbi:hypothetical protein EDD21DRAFT_392231 [Dissophora ornata]|nr:hypothetical protein BGZ58_001292 [Dissophora ornata]KAI8595035.1 hypothetical protein EDD21DRAFT_392231 [Dissophora ornata]
MSTLTNPALASSTDAQETEQTFQPSDFSFLSQLLVILQKVESGEDAQEVATLASNLKASFKKCQMILDHLPGADLSPDEQSKILAEEIQVLEKKKAQLASYLSWQVFQHQSTDTVIKEDPSDDTHIPGSALSEPGPSSESISAGAGTSGSSSQKMDSSMVDHSEVEIKREHQEWMPSLVTDVSFMSDSSQGYAPSSLGTGLTLDLVDIKMDDDSEEMSKS